MARLVHIAGIALIGNLEVAAMRMDLLIRSFAACGTGICIFERPC
jgi:hypothetical protein